MYTGMTTRICVQCFTSHEYYHTRTIPDCPRCGAIGMYDKPLTSEEYYRAMGCKTKIEGEKL